MIHEKLEKKLQDQIQKEANSSHIYLAMASWAETNGFEGAAQFLYQHSDEERQHMLKLVKYVNDRGSQAKIPALNSPSGSFNSLREVFQNILEHEEGVTESINEIVDVCLEVKDHITNNFMQWYVAEQLEEEQLARTILDKLELIGDNDSGLYFFDNELKAGLGAHE
jgi:ferritin